MNINWNLVLTILFAIIPALSVLFALVKKFFPNVDPYFQKGAFILAEVDNVIDAILLEYPENPALKTVNDVVDKVLNELKQAGYSVDPENEKKIENRVKARIKYEEGAKVKWEDGKLKLEINKPF